MANDILVIEDDPGIAWIVRRYLEHDGRTVTTASDGVSGLNAARADNPDLAGLAGILLVILMSRRTPASIGSLPLAARELGTGNLSSRAVMRGDDEVPELGHAFNNMADALKDSERRRRNLVADVAHELRTPLTNIQGHIEATLDGLITPDAESLDTARRQTPAPQPAGGRSPRARRRSVPRTRRWGFRPGPHRRAATGGGA